MNLRRRGTSMCLGYSVVLLLLSRKTIAESPRYDLRW